MITYYTFLSLCLCPQIPQIFYSLQDSVKAVLLGCVTVADWFEKGVPAKSFVEEWTISVPLEEGGEREEEGGRGGAAVACDGRFLYIHGSFGLAKVGSGYGNTQRVSYFVLPLRMIMMSMSRDWCTRWSLSDLEKRLGWALLRYCIHMYLCIVGNLMNKTS